MAQDKKSAASSIMLICGLGNPGSDYTNTRHNAGFAVVDALAQSWGVRYWKSEAGCEVAEVHTDFSAAARTVLLAKPQGYMNTSGGPLSKLMRGRGVHASEVLVIHDEVDLAEGQVRLKQGGGLNSHNGLRSISDKLGTRDFARLQVGIGRPPGKMPVATYVLRELKGTQLQDFEITVAQAAQLAEKALADGVSPR